MLPCTDYGSLYQECKKRLMQHEMIDRHLNLSSPLKLITDRIPLQTLIDTIEDIKKINRSMYLRTRPLYPEELLIRFLQQPGIPSIKDSQKLKKFWDNRPLEKKRRIVERNEKEAEEASKQQKGKNKR